MRLCILSSLLLISLSVQPYALGSRERKAGAGEEGDLMRITGRITRNGNEPFSYPVIETETTVYRLYGEKADLLSEEYQQRTVTLRGRIAEGRLMPDGLPLFEVEEVLESTDDSGSGERKGKE